MTPARVDVTSARVLCGYDKSYAATPEELTRRPILVEHAFGRGMAFLVTAWEYPADSGLLPFTEDLLRTVLAGEQGDLRVLASDRVRYAVYDGGLSDVAIPLRVVYLLNTDPDCTASARLWIAGRQTGQFEIPANDLRLAYIYGALALIPTDRHCDIKSVRMRRQGLKMELFSAASQQVEIHNTGAQPVCVTINHARARIAPGVKNNCRVSRHIDPRRQTFFADDFLDEPSGSG